MQKITWQQIAPAGEAFHLSRMASMRRETGRLHEQDYPEIFWIERGSGMHIINGVEKHLKPGDLIWVRRTDQHGFRNVGSGGFVLTNLAFPQATADHFQERYWTGREEFFRHPGMLPCRMELTAPRLEMLREWTNFLDQSPRTHAVLDRFLLELLHDLSAAPMSDSGEPLPEWLAEALRVFRKPEHLTGGVQELSAISRRTPEHINATLRKFTGRTTSETVNRMRMDVAASQLRISTKKILEIALDSGIENLGHFYSVFRRHFGMTPKAYRLRHQTAVGRGPLTTAEAAE